MGDTYFKQLLMGLVEWTSEGRVLYGNGMECCVVTSERVLRLNNSLWDWESGLQREGCCIVMGWSAVLRWVGELLFKQHLYGIGRVDFRGKGAV